MQQVRLSLLSEVTCHSPRLFLKLSLTIMESDAYHMLHHQLIPNYVGLIFYPLLC